MTYLPVKVARVVNAAGLTFNVRLVRPGDHYGRENNLVHSDPDPLVEFWDASYEKHPNFTPGLGQLVERYPLSTLAARDSGPLHLCGDVREWQLTSANVEEVLCAVTQYTAMSALLYYKRRAAALNELRELSATYLEGSHTVGRAAELLAAIDDILLACPSKVLREYA